MPHERQVYLLDPQSIDPETIAVAFAKTSRSPQSFRKIAAELTAERSAAFHEKWVVGYGHASVAEHAVLHVALENVSRLAVETIESSRLASFTEKSTRYQKWAPDEFFTPPEIERDAPPALKALYQDTCRELFEAYLKTLPAVRANVEQDHPREAGESYEAWERRIRSEYVDVCRFLLPAAALANLGMTINARELEHALCKMLSHPLEEVRQVGTEIKAVALESVPTLLKYVDRAPYLEETGAELEQIAAQAQVEALPADWCSLAGCTADGETRVLAAALYRFGEFSYAQSTAYVAALPAGERAALAQALLGRLGQHDIPLRETEYAAYTFDVLIDQGAYFELKRHRMMTQTPQALTTRLGYAIPKAMSLAGVEGLYRRAMSAASELCEELRELHPEAAAYVVPNGYNRRVLCRLNLRELFQFTKLRASENAHFSIRRAALRMAELAVEAHPLFCSKLCLPALETAQSVSEAYFTDVCAKPEKRS